MSQPPHSPKPPQWRRPQGVAAGTWKYVNERSIARHYDDFVADTPLCRLDRRYVVEFLNAFLTMPGSASRSSESENSIGAKPLVIDLGAGTGRLSQPISDLGFDVLAIDLSQSMLEELRTKTAHSSAETRPSDSSGESSPSSPGATAPGSVFPIRANLVQLDSLREAVADHAICMFSTIGMIQGRDNRIRFLRHVARAVRPGGSLIIHAHRRWAALREPGGIVTLMRSAMNSVRKRDAEFGDATYCYRGLDKMFMHRFTARELTSDLMESGWNVRRIDWVNLDGSDLTKSAWNASGLFVIGTREEEACIELR